MLEITSDNNVQSLETLGKLKDVTGNADLGTDNAGKQGAKFCDREKTFCANETTPSQRGCVYCDATDPIAVNCNKFVTVGEFNCTGSRHRAAECKCRSGCQICSRRHLTSICDKPTSRDQLMTTTSIA